MSLIHIIVVLIGGEIRFQRPGDFQRSHRLESLRGDEGGKMFDHTCVTEYQHVGRIQNVNRLHVAAIIC